MRTIPLAEELEAVVASGSTARRTDILNRITDLFIYGAERYSADQILLFGDVMARLMRGMRREARAKLAERLAPVANAPANLIQLLALDHDATVARSVLARSQRLTERDLLLIAGSKTQPHLLALAQRAELSARVIDVLIARGDRDVLGAIVRNNSARFSTAAWRRLRERTRGDAALAAQLARRPDAEQHDRSRTGGETEVYCYARKGKLAETASALSVMSGISGDAVERALLNPRAEALLVIAKAAGLSSITTEALLRLHAADRGMSGDDVARALTKFNRMPRDSARRVLNFFRIRLEKPAAAMVPPEPRITP